MIRHVYTILVVGVAIGISAAMSPAQAHARPEPVEQEYCAILVGKAPEGVASPVIGRACSSISSEAARRDLNALLVSDENARSAPMATAATRLITYYQEYALLGRSAEIYGDQGTCDYSGYRIAVDPWWGGVMKSIGGHGNCNTAYITNKAQTYAEIQSLPVRYLSSSLVRNVGIIQAYYR